MDAGGKWDASLIDDADIDHGLIGGLGDDDHTQYILVDGTRAFTGQQSMGTNKIINLADGVAAKDAVNKSQLDAIVAGFDLKERVRLGTIAALDAYGASGGPGIGRTLTASGNGALTIDSVAAADGDRVLIKDEAVSHVDHGIYDVIDKGSAGTPWILTRSTDADENAEVTNGLFVFVLEGTVNNNSGWAIVTPDPITVDTTTIQFSQFQGLPQFTASLGVEKVGNNFQADLVASGGLKVVGNELKVEPNDFAGTGLQDDGADNMEIDFADTATEMGTSRAVAASDLSANGANQGGYILGADPASITVSSATTIQGVLEDLDSAIAAAAGAGIDYTAGTGGVTKGDLLYISGTDTVLPLAITGAPSSNHGIGLAETTEIATATVRSLPNDSVLATVLVAQTPGSKQYWDGSALTSTVPAGSGAMVWQAGIAKNATDLHIDIIKIKRNAA